MSEIKGKYKKIIEDLESNIKDPQELEYVKEKFSEFSMLFIDMIDRITKLTDNRINQIEERQQDIINRMNSVQDMVEEIEDDIYGEDRCYEFEIVCPYCNYEFTADIEDESKEEVECPECHNTIELDWNDEDDVFTCQGSCSHCGENCFENDEIDEDDVFEDDPLKDNKNDEDDKEDM